MKFERYGRGIAKGLTVTMRNLVRRRVTTQYPEQRLTVSRRIRGNELVWNGDRCTGCATCARTCPQGVIRIVTRVGEDNRYIPETFEVDTGYCISCGLCVEACPYDVLFMGYAFELARFRRGDLIHNRDELLWDGKRPSGYFQPKIAAALPEQTLLIDRDGEKE